MLLGPIYKIYHKGFIMISHSNLSLLELAARCSSSVHFPVEYMMTLTTNKQVENGTEHPCT